MTGTPPDQGTTARPGYAGFATKHKYKAKPVTIDGIRFASQAEAKRYGELISLEAAGEISNLELQPKYPIVINGAKICTYIADFRYFTNTSTIIEDVKGMITPVYRIKKKLVESLYPGVTITEIGRCSKHSSSPKNTVPGRRKKAKAPAT